MAGQKSITFTTTASILLAGSLLAGTTGCSSSGTGKERPADVPVASGEVNVSADAAAAMAPAAPAGQPGVGQELFASDKEAAKALSDAAKANDLKEMHHIFGPAGKELASGDRVEDRNDREDFARRAAEQLRLVQKDDHTSVIYVGKEDWPFPIPLVRMGSGKWFFDTEAGKEEILARRIGENELETIEVCRTYAVAQREYANTEHDNSGVFEYAQHLLSSPGKHDGLYWEAKAGEDESPLGPLVADARMEGYGEAGSGNNASNESKPSHHHPFHGYFFHILTRQGPKAPGGTMYDYVINGHMLAGFALVASPEKYGSSGIMTFMISNQGKLYQKDLGAATTQVVHGIKSFDLDETWTLVKE